MVEIDTLLLKYIYRIIYKNMKLCGSVNGVSPHLWRDFCVSLWKDKILSNLTWKWHVENQLDMSKLRIYLILSYLESSFTSVCFSLYFWIWASWVWMTFLAMSSTTWSASTAASLNDCSASDIAPFLTKEKNVKKFLKNFTEFLRTQGRF